MRLRDSLLISLAALVLGAAPAAAARNVPVLRPLTMPTRPLQAGAHASDPGTCMLGVTGPAASVVSYVIPPDDQYYTLLDPEDCACAGHGGYTPTAAHIVVEFGYAYDTPVRVGVVRADLSDPECPKPVPGDYLVPPLDYALAAPAGGVYDVEMPLTAGACLTETAFLEITFTDWGFSYEVPSLVLTASCEPCRSYNYYPGDDYDLCTFGFPGNPIMYAAANCCTSVPALHGTWGRLKSIYR